jgi:YfiH family protein
MWKLDRSISPVLWRMDPEPAGLRAAFTTRQGGVSEPPYDSLNVGRSTRDRAAAVAENRRRTLTRLALDPERLATAGQVHSASVVTVRSPGLVPECDALVTRESNLVLAITSADCLPILFTVSGAVAAAHAGWRGLAAGVARATLKTLCTAAGADPREVQVHFGPCIRACCYNVGPEVAERFPAAATSEVKGERRLSLPTAARLELVSVGVPSDAIQDTEACTACEPGLYFSHRRDHGLTGRHWGLIAITA